MLLGNAALDCLLSLRLDFCLVPVLDCWCSLQSPRFQWNISLASLKLHADLDLCLLLSASSNKLLLAELTSESSVISHANST